MPETPRQIAKRVLPGWKVVKTSKAPKAVGPADVSTPSLTALRKAYGLERAKIKEGFASASAEDADTEFVVMEPPSDNDHVGRKVVVVSKGKAVAVQG